MEFTSFNAQQGDAFTIKTENAHILVDGGMPSTYGQIKDYIDKYPLEAIFITHVDYDHLGGLFNLVSDESLDLTTCQMYMNHPEFPSEHQGEEVGFKHGHSLRKLLNSRGTDFHQVSTGQQLTIGDLNVLVLSPDELIIKALYDAWQSNIIYEDGSLKYKEKQSATGDIINRSSLILLVSCENNRVLMLGDAHAEAACKSVTNLGYSAEVPLTLNLLKLSHHGSKHNTNRELLTLIDCQNYYISTNGGKYDHPDSETIRLLEERATELGTSFNIYLNYDIESDIRNRCDFSINNLIFIEQCSLEFT
ncbi:TPA: MBL fold metallo-hydrolase [Vibrio parahaemolyticus]|nr:MBL fold metallo-hydrolase [Vibrio parahaemolyticus]